MPHEPLPIFPRSRRRVSRRVALASLTFMVTGIAAAGWLTWQLNTPHPLFTYRGHSDAVNTAVWSFNGQRVASGSNDRTVQIWNASNGGNVLTYRGHCATLNVVGWSSDCNPQVYFSC